MSVQAEFIIKQIQGYWSIIHGDEYAPFEAREGLDDTVADLVAGRLEWSAFGRVNIETGAPVE